MKRSHAACASSSRSRMLESGPTNSRIIAWSVSMGVRMGVTFQIGDAHTIVLLEKVVSRIFASWNQMGAWLKQIDRLPNAA